MTKNFLKTILTNLDINKDWEKISDGYYKYVGDIEQGIIPFDRSMFSTKSLKFNKDNTVIYMNSNINNLITINIKEDLTNIDNIPELQFLKDLKEGA